MPNKYVNIPWELNLFLMQTKVTLFIEYILLIYSTDDLIAFHI